MYNLKFDIPLNHVISAFDEHLQSHPRTIFSAPFGEGKTYFLNQFKTDSGIQEKYTCLTVYPVNYQVAENADIFELIKRDILMQLVYNGMIPSDYELPESLMAQFFILNEKENIALYLLEGLTSLPAFRASNVVQGLKSIITFKKKIESQYDKFKKKYEKSDAILGFIDNIDKHYLYENDVITNIIKNCIEKYKEETGKKVVLIFEDMDRIDPAHLFRILNVLSAQVDYSYKYGLSSDYSSIYLNKFGVDNIVVVFDYKNAKHLFAHLYGEDVDFTAYIHKFMSSTSFEFSISDVRRDYIYEHVCKETKIDKGLIELILPYDSLLSNKTMREISVAIIDTELAIKEIPLYDKLINTKIPLNTAVLQLLVILHRLNAIDSAKEYIYIACQNQPLRIFQYLGGYIMLKDNQTPLYSIGLSKSNRWTDTQRADYYKAKEHKDIQIIGFNDISQSGICRCDVQEYSYNPYQSMYNIDELVDYLYSYILK